MPVDAEGRTVPAAVPGSDGASLYALMAVLSNGYKPHSLNPDCKWRGLMERDQSFVSKEGNTSLVMVAALLSTLYVFTIDLHAAFTGPKTATSNGCRTCVVFGGRQYSDVRIMSIQK